MSYAGEVAQWNVNGEGPFQGSDVLKAQSRFEEKTLNGAAWQRGTLMQ